MTLNEELNELLKKYQQLEWKKKEEVICEDCATPKCKKCGKPVKKKDYWDDWRKYSPDSTQGIPWISWLDKYGNTTVPVDAPTVTITGQWDGAMENGPSINTGYHP